MTSSASDNFLITIGKGIYLHKPTAPEAADPSHPTVILVFGWTGSHRPTVGAKLLHLQKYTSIYHGRYPNSVIILVRSEAAFFWSSQYSQWKALSPVVETLEAIGCLPPAQPRSRRTQVPELESLIPLPEHRVLTHTFSNGGCCQLTTLSDILSKRQSSPSTSTIHMTSAIILDSCPGSESLSAARRAFSSAFSHPIIRILANVVVTLLYCVQILARHLFRRHSVIKRMKSRLNDPHVLPWTGKSVPRLYIYSDGDEIVSTGAVEKHAAEAKAKGLNVHVEKFGRESKHVAHSRADPKRYWGAVERVWREALNLESKDA